MLKQQSRKFEQPEFVTAYKKPASVKGGFGGWIVDCAKTGNKVLMKQQGREHLGGSVEHLTYGFGSNCEPRVERSSLALGSGLSLEPASESASLPPSLSVSNQ